MSGYEINFDGLVGPTHNYAGLSHGNVASAKHAGNVANPRKAALQGLQKMKFVRDLGIRQAVLPPHARPAMETLHQLGFSSAQQAAKESPSLLAACYSASAMWVANAATISPSTDTLDGKLHITPANLASKLHRSIEPATTAIILKKIFADDRYFTHHSPLPCVEAMGDEGAANHTRLAPAHSEEGIELFVYGRHAYDQAKPAPVGFPARQTYEASSSIARLHQLSSENAVFAQQNPAAIDAGVFHNDVICVGNGNSLFYHEKAFLDTEAVLAELQAKYGKEKLHFLCVRESDVTLQEAVQTYLFNSQLLTLPDGSMALISPKECEENQAVKTAVEKLCADNSNPLKTAHFLDVRESMHNGGGPACLRLRVQVNEAELAAMHQGIFLTDTLYARLVTWVETHYRDSLHPDDLVDPHLVTESFTALDELTQILGLGSIYPFQQP